jgi:ADP-ribose pyrophosphatase YjhB (NUDIX family)
MKIRQVFTHYNLQEHQIADQFLFCPFCRSQLALIESGRKARATCLACGFVQYKNPAPAVSILVVDGDQMLLGRRFGAPGAGLWAMPSGYVEWEDDFLTAAIRETKEETGLDVEICSIVHVVSSFLSPRFHFLAIYVLARVVGGELCAGDDLEVVEWFPLSGPLPDMAFEEDLHVIDLYTTMEGDGLPVDPNFVRAFQVAVAQAGSDRR